MSAADDHNHADETGQSRESRRPIWHRGLFMLFFIVAFSIAQTLLTLIAVVQFLSLLIAGKPNGFIANFGRSLGLWLDQVALFQSADSDERPFPWAPWPPAR
ncbi:MAG: DUF4389 domain-containing protein [Paracoccaceae bacterium]|nr:DUF4389 domain-containing protein [Paracoccaceae bacterium]